MYSNLETIITAVVTAFFALATRGNFVKMELPATSWIAKNLFPEVVETAQSSCDPAPPVKKISR